MRVVLDTCVLVAAMRSQRGASHRLLRQLPSPKWQPALSVPLFTEWQAVLTRAENLPQGVSEQHMLGFVDYVAACSHLQAIHYLWRPMLRDPDDDMVLECAAAAQCRFIVTHNVRDFAAAASLNIRAITPANFLALLEQP